MNFQRHKGLKKMMKIRIAIVLFLYCAATTVVYAHGKADADAARNIIIPVRYIYTVNSTALKK